MSKKGGTAKAGGSDVKLETLAAPEFWANRLDLFDKLYAAQLERYNAQKAPIKIKLLDGKEWEAESWVSTPMEIAKRISNSLPDKCIVAKVNGQLWDLTRPFEGDAALELLTWDEPEARHVFWHSSSHVLGYALERVYQCKLSVGPALEDGGFFYEGETNRPIAESDYSVVQNAMTELVKAKAPYQRLVIRKEDALQLFAYSHYKTTILAKKVPDDSSCTVYRCGNMIDPCRGPHLPDTSRVKAYAVTKNSSSYFEGDAENANLQRLYGISFPQAKLLEEWKTIQEEAAKRDHRNIGKHQELFGFHELSPGSAFWLPHGARIFNTLVEFIRRQYRKRGFTEVISPNIFNAKLWKVSGHWKHYQDAMFRTQSADDVFGLKPMNCPGHCLLYGLRPHSYKDLPIRMAEFGVLHRNELTGALTGLTRVRRFQQDDAHIFCRRDQIEEEMLGALRFLDFVYGVFGFIFHLKLSTRPELGLGTVEIWEEAESKLSRALNEYCGIEGPIPDPFTEGATFTFDGTPGTIKKLKESERRRAKQEGENYKPRPHEPWEVNPGDGAFYGPKIDIQVEDALKRRHQCATIQLDFNLPESFGLKFTLPDAKQPKTQAKTDKLDNALENHELAEKTEEVKEDLEQAEEKIEHVGAQAKKNVPEEAPEDDIGYKVDRQLDPNQERPVMIHRAIFGSLERCIAILCEHYGGKWPFWLSPRQAVVIPVAKSSEQYARDVKDRLYDAGFFIDVDESNATLEKKIRNSQISQYNFILVAGEKEVEQGVVDVRTRDNARHGQKAVDDVLNWMRDLAATYSRDF